MRKKIIFAINHFYEGGAQRVVANIINNIYMEHDVYVIVLDNIIRYEIPLKNISYIHLSKFKAPRLFRVPIRLYNYIKLIKSINPDAIFSFGNFFSIYTTLAIKLSLKNNIKHITSERTDPSKEPKSKFWKAIRNWAYNNSSLLVCQTKDVESYFNSRLTVKTKVIYNPIKSNLPRWQGNSSNKIITACRLEKQKNIPLLIKAFTIVHEKHKNIILEIYGEGSEKNNIMKIIQDYNLSHYVIINGFSKDIHKIMAQSLVYASSSDYEGISNSMLEALGIGIPTIVTDCPVGGAKLFIKNGINGFLVETNNYQSLAEGLLKLIEDESIRIKFSEQSIEINKKLNIDYISKQWLDLLE